MKNFRFIIVLLISYLFTGLTAQSSINGPFSWPEGKSVAVCLTYDDGLDCHLDVAVPALNRYEFKGTFYCNGNSFSLNQRIEDWRAIASEGHELGNHTLFHPCNGEQFDWVKPEYDLNNYSMEQIMAELRTANTLLEAVDGKKLRSFAYSCSNHIVQGISFIDSMHTLFPAARGDGPIPESMSDINLYFVPSWGVDEPTGEELIAYVEEAKAKGTIAVFMFHNVGGGYLNVSAEAHETLLKYLDQSRNSIWTGTFLEVMEYAKLKGGSGLKAR